MEKLKLRGDAIKPISNKEVRKIVTGGVKSSMTPLPPKKTKRGDVAERASGSNPERYFRTDETQPGGEPSGGAGSAGSIFRGLLDYAVGILLAVAVFLYFHSFIAAGVAAAFFGIFIGIVEMFLRGRDPSVMKMLFFVGTGAALYVYGYYFL